MHTKLTRFRLFKEFNTKKTIIISFSKLLPLYNDELALGKAYIRKRPIGCIFMVCQDIQQERKCLNTLLIAVYRYDKILNRKLAILAEEEKYY